MAQKIHLLVKLLSDWGTRNYLDVKRNKMCTLVKFQTVHHLAQHPKTSLFYLSSEKPMPLIKNLCDATMALCVPTRHLYDRSLPGKEIKKIFARNA